MSEQEGVILTKLDELAKDVREVVHTVKNVQQTQSGFGERLTRLEVQYDNHTQALTRAFESVKDHEGRVQRIEVEQPLTKWARGLVLSGLVAATGAGGFGTYVIAKVVDRPIVIQIDGKAISSHIKERPE